MSGGQSASTLGIEVTSQSVGTTGTAPNLSTIMGTGFGGLSLVQMGAAGTNGPGRASPASSGVKWAPAHYVCADSTTHGDVVDNGTTPCNRGTYVGMSVGDTTSSTSHQVDLVQEPIVQGGALLTFYCMNVVTSGQTLYMFPGATSTSCTTSTNTSMMQPLSFSGRISNLEVFYGTAPGTGHTDTFTVYRCPALASCAATAVKCSISGAGTPSTCSDISDTVSVSQGDGIQIVDTTGASSVAKDARITIQIQ